MNTDPLSALRALRDHAPKNSIAFFRTSDAQKNTFAPRLTIIGVEPAEIIQCKSGSANPFDLINRKLKEKKIAPLPSLPFFQGGAMGYFSFDAVRHLEPTLLKPKNAAEYFDAEIVFYRYYFIFGHLENKALILTAEPDTSATKTRLQELEKIALAGKPISAPSEITAEIAGEVSTDRMSSNLTRDGFLDGIAKLKRHILEGDIFQAVLSDDFTAPFAGDPLALFEILASISPAPYQFYFAIDDRAYLGASPEMLLKATKNIIETHPIAGTRPRGKSEMEEKRLEDELLADEKEKAEHLMLVDLARNDIGRVSEPGTVKVDTFQKVRKFGGVMHIVSTVSGTLSNKLTSIEALASCFPAGTLSGAPKIRAMDLLTEIEKKPRGFYGGAFVVASLTGDLDSCISIRSISIANGNATIQAGAGIVADSIPEKEYEEVQHKTRLTRKALAIALQQQQHEGGPA